METFLGVGVYEKGEKYSCKGNPYEYEIWGSMLKRCYSSSYLKKFPTYLGCSVSENFKNFQYFAEWCQSQVGFKSPKFQLDKDLLVKGNKVYSEDTCVFIPQSLNSLLLTSNSIRGEYPIGVRYRFGRYQVRCSNGYGITVSLGGHSNVETAFEAYKTFKKSVINQQAELWKDKIDNRVYNALLNWEIIDDRAV